MSEKIEKAVNAWDIFEKAFCTKEKILPVCPNCTKEEHEGYFCRCEGRNIRLARQLREEGKGAWI